MFKSMAFYHDDGEWFDQNGQIKRNTGMEYAQTTEWKIEPGRKGPVPADLNYQLPDGTATFRNQIFSIDGEKYPA